jgi:hypothetical protein
MAKEKESAKISVPPIDIRRLTLRIVGVSPLIVHKWSEKAKREILEKQQKKAKTKGYDIRDPYADFVDSIYWLEHEPAEKTEEAFEAAIKKGAKFGFPAVAAKAAAVAAGYRSGVTKDKVSTNGAFHIDGEFIEIEGLPTMREDMVRIGMGTADLRYRAEFKDWGAEVTVKYNAAAISDEQVINLFNLGGFSCGIGENRPEKGGTFGMFHVE